MEQYSFNRRYELAITAPIGLFEEQRIREITEKPTTPKTITWKAAEDYTAVVVNTYTITDLQITASIESSNKTSGSDTNNSTIKIFNMSKETRDSVCGVNNTVVLKAGYYNEEDELPILFCGQIVDFHTEKRGSDVITTLECSEGNIPLTTTQVSINIPAGKTYGDVFQTLAREWEKAGVATGKVETSYQLLLSDPKADLTPSDVIDVSVNNAGVEQGVSTSYEGLSKTLPPQDIVLYKGWSYTGNLRDAMDELSEMFNHSWYILNNALYVHPKYYGKMIKLFELEENQIISIESRQTNTQSGATSTEPKGFVVSIFLDGRVDIASRVKILSGDYSGEYPVDAITHSLDYESGAWTTKVELGGVSK